MARVLAIAEAYVSMVSEHSYKSTLTHEEAVKEIINCSGTQFDPKLVEEMQKFMYEEDAYVRIT